MRRRSKVFSAAVVAASLVAATSFSAFGAEAAVDVSALDVSSVADMTVSGFGTNNTDTGRAEHDTGHIYVGVAVTDGEVDEANSNWADRAVLEDGVYQIVLNDEVEGEGFTASRAFGEGTFDVTGNL